VPEQAGFRVVETTPNCYHSLDARDKAGNLRYSRTTNWFYNLEIFPHMRSGTRQHGASPSFRADQGERCAPGALGALRLNRVTARGKAYGCHAQSCARRVCDEG